MVQIKKNSSWNVCKQKQQYWRRRIANNVEILTVRAVPDGDEYDKDIALGIRYA
jgi:hypothetical protein